MAIDIHTQTQQERAEVDRTLGGNLLVWFAGLALGLGLFLVAVRLAPGIGGFALMAVSGVLGGLSYAELMLRMPSVTHRFTFSLLLTLVVLVVIVGGALAFAHSLPAPQQNPDVNLLPTQS